MCLPFRNGAFDAIKSTSALSLIPSSLRAAVRWKGLHFRNHLTAKLAKRWLFHKCQLLIRSSCSTERQGNKRSAAADLIASIAPMRTRTMYARQASFPRIKSKIPKGGFGALWHAFLLYLSSCNERWSPRRAYRKENAGKNGKPQKSSPGGRIVKNAAGKNVKQTTGLPEGRRFRRAVSKT